MVVLLLILIVGLIIWDWIDENKWRQAKWELYLEKQRTMDTQIEDRIEKLSNDELDHLFSEHFGPGHRKD